MSSPELDTSEVRQQAQAATTSIGRRILTRSLVVGLIPLILLGLVVVIGLSNLSDAAATEGTGQAVEEELVTRSIDDLEAAFEATKRIDLDIESRNFEQDPDTLESLFKLDHLATRMRRNAESLLVLAGDRSPRRWAKPIEVQSAVEAALAEVENYDRVDLGAMDDGKIQGNIVADVAHTVG